MQVKFVLHKVKSLDAAHPDAPVQLSRISTWDLQTEGRTPLQGEYVRVSDSLNYRLKIDVVLHERGAHPMKVLEVHGLPASWMDALEKEGVWEKPKS